MGVSPCLKGTAHLRFTADNVCLDYWLREGVPGVPPPQNSLFLGRKAVGPLTSGNEGGKVLLCVLGGGQLYK